MKKHILVLSALVLLLALPRAATFAQTFEGTVYWTLSVPHLDDQNHEMKINLKGEKSETEIDLGAQGEVKTFVDRSSKKMYVVMEAMHMGMVGDLPSDSTANAIASKEVLDIKPTGKKQSIAGHQAEEYILKMPKGDMSLWAAGDFPKELRESMHHSMGSQPGQGQDQGKAFRFLAEKGLFPVKVEMHGGEAEGTKMEFVKYEQKSIDEAVVTPPTDIKFNPMPKMGGHM